MITVVFANVVLRFTTGKSLIWTEEVAAIGFIWTIFLGAAVCYKQRGGLISMDVLVGGLHGKSRKYADLIIDALQVVLCIVFFFLSWKFARKRRRMTYEFHAVDSPFGFLCSEYSHRIFPDNGGTVLLPVLQ